MRLLRQIVYAFESIAMFAKVPRGSNHVLHGIIGTRPESHSEPPNGMLSSCRLSVPKEPSYDAPILGAAKRSHVFRRGKGQKGYNASVVQS